MSHLPRGAERDGVLLFTYKSAEYEGRAVGRELVTDLLGAEVGNKTLVNGLIKAKLKVL